MATKTSDKAKQKLTDKERVFALEYLRDLNATKAALRAKYSKNSAYQIGFAMLKKPHIRKFIDDKLKEHHLGADETLKGLSDIAKSSLNEYFKIRQVERTPKIVVPLKQIIAEIKQQIVDNDKFISRAKLSEKQLEDYAAERDRRKNEIIQLEIELERNPNATRIVHGQPVLEEVADLDLAKLIKDEAGGRIKSVKPTEFGQSIELYPADAALRDLARIHGLFEKDNLQSKAIVTIEIE